MSVLWTTNICDDQTWTLPICLASLKGLMDYSQVTPLFIIQSQTSKLAEKILEEIPGAQVDIWWLDGLPPSDPPWVRYTNPLRPYRAIAMAISKNRAFMAAIAQNFDHVFMVDSDLEYKPDTVSKLLSHNYPFVQGTFFAPFPTPIPFITAFMCHLGGQIGNKSISYLPQIRVDINEIAAGRGKGTFFCDQVGMGFTLLDKSVFSKYKLRVSPWGTEKIVGACGCTWCGEIILCQDWSRDTKKKILVDLSTMAHHHRRDGGRWPKNE